MGAVGTHDSKLIINEGRLKVIGDKSAVLAQTLGETPPEIVERQVMIAGDDDLRPGKRIQEITRLLELGVGGMLNQVARDHQGIRADLRK
jgi:hypothetical protein